MKYYIISIISLYFLAECYTYAANEIRQENIIKVSKVMQDASHNIQLSVETAKDNYQIGETIDITIILKNIGTQRINLMKTTSFTTFNINLLFANGPPTGTFMKNTSDKVPLTLFGQIEYNLSCYKRNRLKLEPKQEYRIKINLNRIFDMSLATRYKITISKKLPASFGQEVSIVTPAIFLTVSK